MKKQLLSTSVIALGVAMAAPATAQEWNMNWGGFHKAYVGVTSISGSAPGAQGDVDGVDVFNDGEIHFKPSITLDNGMTIGIDVQLESTTTGGPFIDETYLYIQSDTLGRIILGAENSAGYMSMVGAPGVTQLWINSPSSSAFIPRTGTGGFRQAGLSSYTEVGGNNDVPRITYFTPRFNGLRLGVSYAATANGSLIPGEPGNAGNNFAPDRNTRAMKDIFDVGLNYSQSFGGADVNIGARWGTANGNIPGYDDPTTWGIGATIGMNGWTFGGSYTENDNGAPGGVGVGAGDSDQKGWSLGVTYDMPGPWSFEALTYQGEVKTGGTDSDNEVYRIGAARNLAPGVTWETFYIYQETNNGRLAGNPDIEGHLFGTGIRLNF